MAVASTRQRKVPLSATITREQEEILDVFARLQFNGNRSAAVSYLIDTHAGKEVERDEQRREVDADEDAGSSYRVERWKQPKLSMELIGYVAGLVRAGNLLEIACNNAAISEHQRRSWMKQGKSDRREGRQSLQASFVAAVEQAEAECTVEDIRRLRSWGDERWQALAWRLERQYPDHFAQRKRIDGKVQHSLTPMIDYDKLTAAETRTLVFLLRKASPDSDEVGVSRNAPPAIELVPADVLDAVEGVDFSEAPVLEDGGEPLALEPSAGPIVDVPAQLEKHQP